MLYGVGLQGDDFGKPQIGISSVWYEGNPCNMHLLSLAEEVKKGVEESGMIGFRFNTVRYTVTFAMGTEGMSFSLQSRDIIADSVETVMCGQLYDGNISLPGGSAFLSQAWQLKGCQKQMISLDRWAAVIPWGC